MGGVLKALLDGGPLLQAHCPSHMLAFALITALVEDFLTIPWIALHLVGQWAFCCCPQNAENYSCWLMVQESWQALLLLD